MEKYLYYCVFRPAGPGSIPRGVVSIRHLNPNQYIPEIGQGAYDLIEYDRPLTDKEIYDFELLKCKEGQGDVEQTVG